MSTPLTRNWHGEERPGPFAHCRLCCDSGLVFVGWSQVGTDQMAPCPGCEVGYRSEFGRPDRPGHGPWGQDGFWQGRPHDGLPVCSHDSKDGRAIPEWVYVWAWVRSQGNHRPFPQQAGEGLPGKPLDATEYGEAVAAWKQAGAPKPHHPLGEVTSSL